MGWVGEPERCEEMAFVEGSEGSTCHVRRKIQASKSCKLSLLPRAKLVGLHLHCHHP